MADTYNIENKVVIRDFDEDRDVKVVGKLERNCEIGTTKKGLSIIMSDPLSRIRFYPLRIMLVCNVTIISLLSSFYQILFQIHIDLACQMWGIHITINF
jgi:hypothetical protein